MSRCHDKFAVNSTNNRKNLNQKKHVRSGQHNRAKKLIVMVRAKGQARREWENWNNKIKGLCVIKKKKKKEIPVFDFTGDPVLLS